MYVFSLKQDFAKILKFIIVSQCVQLMCFNTRDYFCRKQTDLARVNDANFTFAVCLMRLLYTC